VAHKPHRVWELTRTCWPSSRSRAWTRSSCCLGSSGYLRTYCSRYSRFFLRACRLRAWAFPLMVWRTFLGRGRGARGAGGRSRCLGKQAKRKTRPLCRDRVFGLHWNGACPFLGGQEMAADILHESPVFPDRLGSVSLSKSVCPFLGRGGEHAETQEGHHNTVTR